MKSATTTENDPILQEVIKLTRYGWPDREQSIRPEVRDYFASRYYSACEDLLFYNDRIVMPEVMSAETIQSLHSGHLGLNKCRERAKSTVWWPRISKDLEQAVRSCAFCNKHRSAQRKEPLMATPLPERPWERVGADLCDHGGKQYLVVVDYCSRYLEIVHLDIFETDLLTLSRFGRVITLMIPYKVLQLCHAGFVTLKNPIYP